MQYLTEIKRLGPFWYAPFLPRFYCKLEMFANDGFKLFMI